MVVSQNPFVFFTLVMDWCVFVRLTAEKPTWCHSHTPWEGRSGPQTAGRYKAINDLAAAARPLVT